MLSELDRINLVTDKKILISLFKEFSRVVGDISCCMDRIEYFLHPEDNELGTSFQLFDKSISDYNDLP